MPCGACPPRRDSSTRDGPGVPTSPSEASAGSAGRVRVRHAEGDRRHPQVRAVYLGQTIKSPHMATRARAQGGVGGLRRNLVLEDIDLHWRRAKASASSGETASADHAARDRDGHNRLHKGEVLLGGVNMRAFVIARADGAGRRAAGSGRRFSRSHLHEPRSRCPPGRGRCARVRAVSQWRERLNNMGTSSPAASSRSIDARALDTPSLPAMDEPDRGLARLIVEALTAVLVRLRARACCPSFMVSRTAESRWQFSERTWS